MSELLCWSVKWSFSRAETSGDCVSSMDLFQLNSGSTFASSSSSS